MADWIGYKWLAARYGIDTVQAPPVTSEIGPSRRTIHNDHITREIYTANMRPEDTLTAHLTFAIKKEIVEGPNQDIDRIIRAIKGNGGQISNKLAATFPVLANAGVAASICACIAAAFEVPGASAA